MPDESEVLAALPVSYRLLAEGLELYFSKSKGLANSAAVRGRQPKPSEAET
jgi:hypothetical protein